MIYETKGLPLEEVNDLYEKIGKAWQSPSYVPRTDSVVPYGLEVREQEKYGEKDSEEDYVRGSHAEVAKA